MLCARRTKEGLDPTCVKHCMAAVIKYGRIEDLAREIDKPRMVLWAPRP
jgi:anaerobic dimethyl sulfoxide reductase subunit B (iron-sulfur subunit)